MTISCTISNMTKLSFHDGIPDAPVLVHLQSQEGGNAMLFLSYPQAVELSRGLRVACGIDLPREDAA